MFIMVSHTNNKHATFCRLCAGKVFISTVVTGVQELGPGYDYISSKIPTP